MQCPKERRVHGSWVDAKISAESLADTDYYPNVGLKLTDQQAKALIQTEPTGILSRGRSVANGKWRYPRSY